MAILTHRPGVLENLQGLLLRVERRSNDERRTTLVFTTIQLIDRVGQTCFHLSQRNGSMIVSIF